MRRRWSRDYRKDCATSLLSAHKKQVQISFLLDALAKQLELSVSDEEVQQQVNEIAAKSGSRIGNHKFTRFYAT